MKQACKGSTKILSALSHADHVSLASATRSFCLTVLPHGHNQVRRAHRAAHPSPFDLSVHTNDPMRNFWQSDIAARSQTSRSLAHANFSSGKVVRVLQDAVLSKEQELGHRKLKKKNKKKKAKEAQTPAKPTSTDNIQEVQSASSDGFLRESIWESENWKNTWGKDKLQPVSGHPPQEYRSAPPHIRRDYNSPLSYTRKIEGLQVAAEGPVLKDLTPMSPHRPIAQLAHGLDRVLFNPGVHWLQDPRSRVYNFPVCLENIPKVTDFAFERLAGFIKSSRDEDLRALAKQENRTFAGSTSSLTGMLSHIYFLISGDKPVDTSVLSHIFRGEPTDFTPGQRMPASVVMNFKDGVYAIDSNSDQAGHAEKNILTWMGTLLEKFLTMSPEEFGTHMRSTNPKNEEEDDPMKEAYRYAKSERFVMRSQLDCYDPRLPGTGVFDIKTRACLPIRLDILNFEENSGYLIRSQHGLLESFEKEYYDLIRSAFLKYSFQARIGNMDGVIVAYHNTSRMFGFQYIPLEEMDERLFGTGPGVGDRVFKMCIGVLENVVDEIARCFPNQSLRCTFETLPRQDVMNVWVEPAQWTSAEERPIKQLRVTAASFLGQIPAKNHRAVSAIDEPWTLHWTVSHLADDENDIRYALKGVKERQFRAYNLPTGVNAKKMEEFWENLNFSGKTVPEDEVALYRPENFKEASPNVKMLRSVARAGREETDRLLLEEAGKPKIVLGEPIDLSDREIQAYADEHPSPDTPDSDFISPSIEDLVAVIPVDDTSRLPISPEVEGTHLDLQAEQESSTSLTADSASLSSNDIDSGASLPASSGEQEATLPREDATEEANPP